MGFAGSARAQGTGSGSSSTSSPSTTSSPDTTRAPAGATAAPGTGAREIQGRVELFDRANNLTLAGSEGAGLAFDKLKVDSSTAITRDGAKASVTEINEGDEVRASVSGSGEDLHVTRLEILPDRSTPAATRASKGKASSGK